MLIGWKGKTAASGPWFRDLLSDGETLFSKEDLIIWPPVVIIHNSSIKCNNPDERVIVSIEVLESILRGNSLHEGSKYCIFGFSRVHLNLNEVNGKLHSRHTFLFNTF